MLFNKFVLVFLLIVFFVDFASAAHFIVGRVNDANDGTSANGKTVVLWNPANGISDNQTDIVGTSGNSGTSNIYLIDCELLSAGCNVGDTLNVRVVNNGDNYVSSSQSVVVTGAGFDVVGNLTLNSPPTISNVSVDDSFSIPSGEIDLTAGGTTIVSCTGIVDDHDGDSTLSNATSVFFDMTNSFFGDSDDNNKHYTNSSCSLDNSYGNANQSFVSCNFSVQYYANSGNWNCTISPRDNQSISATGSNVTFVNQLLALSLPDFIDYGSVGPSLVSLEQAVNVTNAGNTRINLSLSGYARTVGDGFAMNCSGGTQNISLMYEKYNLSAPNVGSLSLAQFESGNYINLTSDVVTKRFDLNYRQSDAASGIDDYNVSYWRIYVPVGVEGSCSGNIVFGATIGAGI